jgi:hypothetical protein
VLPHYATRSPAPRLHVVITTHTPRHLRRTLLGVLWQTRAADSVTISVDGDDPAIRAIVESLAGQAGPPLRLVTRAHQGVCRSAQVRNNGARVALEQARAADSDLLVFYDGDCCPAPDALAQFERLSRLGDVILGHWIPLTPEQTEAFDEDAIRRGQWPARIDDARLAALHRRRARYARHLILRRLGILHLLRQEHKPKLASGNVAVRVGSFRMVNGFDELYEGYGQEDDDLGRRLYRAGARPVIAVHRALVFHQWHPTRRPEDWRDAPGAARFRGRYTTRCEFGLDHPAEQPSPRVEVFGRAPVAAHPQGGPGVEVRT